MGSTTSHYSELQLPEGVYHNRTDYTTHHTSSSLGYSVYIRESKFESSSERSHRYHNESEYGYWLYYIDHIFGTYHV
jgi:hypothetical protein